MTPAQRRRRDARKARSARDDFTRRMADITAAGLGTRAAIRNLEAAFAYLGASYAPAMRTASFGFGRPMSGYGMAGFDGNGELAAGSVIGARSWRMDNEGNLSGSNNWRWARGVNKAECIMRLGRVTPQVYAARGHRRHTVPDEQCGCGFWAYWNLACRSCWQRVRDEHALAAWKAVNGEIDMDRYRAEERAGLVSVADFLRGVTGAEPLSPWHATMLANTLLEGPASRIRSIGGMDCKSGWVHGIVEGTGLTLIGDQGFRSKEATLRALCVPLPMGLAEPWRRDGGGPFLEDVDTHLAMCAMVGTRYGVPVYTDAVKMLGDFEPTCDYMPKAES